MKMSYVKSSVAQWFIWMIALFMFFLFWRDKFGIFIMLTTPLLLGEDAYDWLGAYKKRHLLSFAISLIAMSVTWAMFSTILVTYPTGYLEITGLVDYRPTLGIPFYVWEWGIIGGVVFVFGWFFEPFVKRIIRSYQ